MNTPLVLTVGFECGQDDQGIPVQIKRFGGAVFFPWNRIHNPVLSKPRFFRALGIAPEHDGLFRTHSRHPFEHPLEPQHDRHWLGEQGLAHIVELLCGGWHHVLGMTRFVFVVITVAPENWIFLQSLIAHRPVQGLGQRIQVQIGGAIAVCPVPDILATPCMLFV